MCGQAFHQANNGLKVFCSTQCGIEYRKPVVPVKIVTLIRCRYCGELMKPHPGVEKKYCSIKCRSRGKRAAKRTKP